ncbi:hypothetical protein SAMN05421874_1711 [Nonomuraea maritima]|uniref:Peptidase inhibitor family I36 n=1 Tax=Nonomuraea maritima TaxID=683260 RepID=A0A1G9SVG5_9ACTN|nr:hypothetical protein [Nonomuraea maritima]SDM39401.1 hypothetical protein SAMN05421874_1711 [Nonomuraea maritima]
MRKRPLMFLAAVAIPLTMIGGINATAAFADATPPAPKLPENVWVAPDVDLTKPIVQAPENSGASVARPAACGPYAGTGFPLVWTTYQWIDCSYIGSTSSATKGYSWNSPNWSESEGCAQGMGYRSSSPYWITLGCGKSGSGSASWGNVVGVPKFQSISISAPLSVPINWS